MIEIFCNWIYGLMLEILKHCPCGHSNLYDATFKVYKWLFNLSCQQVVVDVVVHLHLRLRGLPGGRLPEERGIQSKRTGPGACCAILGLLTS